MMQTATPRFPLRVMLLLRTPPPLPQLLMRLKFEQ